MATQAQQIDKPREGAAKLILLAGELRLTDQQRMFCELLRGDPQRNGTKAAIGTGCGNGARVTASRWLKLPKVQAYLSALDDFMAAKDVSRQARSEEGARTQSRIADAIEVQETLTAHMRADFAQFLGKDHNGELTMNFDIVEAQKNGATKLIKEMTVKSGADKDGVPWFETKIKLVDQQGAADKMARVHKLYRDVEDERGMAANVTLIQILAGDPALAQQVGRALLMAGRVQVQQQPAIEIEARPEPIKVEGNPK